MPAAAARPHPPLGEHLLAVPRPGGELAQLRGDGVGEHQVGPADGRLDAAGEAFEPGGVLRPGTRLEQAAVDGPLVEGRGELRPPDGAADLPGAEMQVDGDRSGVAEGGGPQPLAVGGGQPGRLGRQRDLAAPRGIPADVAGEQHRDGEGSRARAAPAGPGGWEASSERDASRRRASAAPSVSASTGSATIPHPRSSASRPATRTSSSGAGRDASRCRSRPSTPKPAACSAAAAVAVPVRRPWSRR